MLPDKFRVESTRRMEDQTETRVEIVNGEKTWNVDEEGHVEVGKEKRSSAGLCTTADRHFGKNLIREYLVHLALDYAGDVQVAGQDCIRIRAVLRPGDSIWPHWLPHGADEYEFHADPQRGTILSIFGRIEGAVFEAYEAQEIAYDEPLADDLFRYENQVGEQVQNKPVVSERLTLEAAARRMPFNVLVPTRVPDPDHSSFEVMYHASRSRSPRAYLSFIYMRSHRDQSLWIHQAASPDPAESDFEWEPIAHEGRALRISDPGAEGSRLIWFEQDGTYVTVETELDRKTALDLASSFVAVPATH